MDVVSLVGDLDGGEDVRAVGEEGCGGYLLGGVGVGWEEGFVTCLIEC